MGTRARPVDSPLTGGVTGQNDFMFMTYMCLVLFLKNFEQVKQAEA